MMTQEQRINNMFNNIMDIMASSCQQSQVSNIRQYRSNCQYQEGGCIKKFNNVVKTLNKNNPEFIMTQCINYGCSQCIVNCFRKYIELNQQQKLE